MNNYGDYCTKRGVYEPTQSKLSSPVIDAEMHLRFLYSVFGLSSIEMGTSVRFAAKGDMEILMSWPKVVATVGAVIVVVVIIAPPICQG